jgi:hypothetical protein
MVKSVVREFQWLPTEIGSLFIDDADYLGLEFWYNDIVQVAQEFKNKNPKK